MADSTPQRDEIGSEPNVTRQSPKSNVTTLYSQCHSNIKEEATFNESLCDSEVDMDSESSTATPSLTSSEIVTEYDSRDDTIIDLGLDRKFGTSSTKCALNQHLYTDDSDTLVETSSQRSSKRVKMEASWNNTNFDLRSVLGAPPSPQTEKSTSNRELNLSPEANHKVNPTECAASLNESSSDQVISEGELDFRSNSDDEVSQFGHDEDYFQSQYDPGKMKNDFLYESGFDLRSVITDSSSSKPTSESVLDFDSEFANYKENILKRKQADCRPPRHSKKNGNYYDYDFDLRSTLSESPSPTSESVLEFESVVANYNKNLLRRKQVDYRHERNPTKDGYQHDPDFDLRSTLSESSSPKPTSENVPGLESVVGNYNKNLLRRKQVDYRHEYSPTLNDYQHDPDFELRSTVSESPSPKTTSENKLDFDSETSSKASKSNQTNNRPRSVSVFDLRYVLDAKQSDMTSEECAFRQQIIMQSKSKLIQMHSDTTVFNSSGFFIKGSKKTLKRNQQKHRSLCRKYLKEVINGDNFDPVKQQLAEADETPSAITEFLRRMRSESDKRKDSKSVEKPSDGNEYDVN